MSEPFDGAPNAVPETLMPSIQSGGYNAWGDIIIWPPLLEVDELSREEAIEEAILRVLTDDVMKICVLYGYVAPFIAERVRAEFRRITAGRGAP